MVLFGYMVYVPSGFVWMGLVWIKALEGLIGFGRPQIGKGFGRPQRIEWGGLWKAP